MPSVTVPTEFYAFFRLDALVLVENHRVGHCVCAHGLSRCIERDKKGVIAKHIPIPISITSHHSQAKAKNPKTLATIQLQTHQSLAIEASMVT